MRLYLAGPMRGYPLFNFPAFTRAAGLLRAAGYTVWSPHERDLDAGIDPAAHSDTRVSPEGFDLCAALAEDMKQVLQADGLVALKGWHRSLGTSAEILTALATGKRVFLMEEDEGYMVEMFFTKNLWLNWIVAPKVHQDQKIDLLEVRL